MARNIKRLVPVTSEKKARRLSAKMPVIAVDMGFSSRKASCGLACDKKLSLPKKCTFGDLVKLFDQKFARKPFILIIEAPLSGAFNLKGNPAARIDKFEKNHPWYSRAGAAMTIAAQHLLQEIDKKTFISLIHLIEGFVPQRPGHKHEKDEKVAELLFKAFSKKHKAQWHELSGDSLTRKSILDWIYHGKKNDCPVILRPELD